MSASDGQIVLDLTISALAETSTGSGVFKLTAAPTAGVESGRPNGVAINAGAGGLQAWFTTVALTGKDLTSLLKVGDRIVVGIDRMS